MIGSGVVNVLMRMIVILVIALTYGILILAHVNLTVAAVFVIISLH